MITLGGWGLPGIEYRLEPRTGQWEVRRLAEAESLERPSGFASRERLWGLWRRFYAFYAHEGRLYFQAGRRKWDITNGPAGCNHWVSGFGMVSGLVLEFANGQSHRAFLVHPLRGLRAMINPAYEAMDVERGLFFKFIHQQVPDRKWRQTFIDRARGFGEEDAG